MKKMLWMGMLWAALGLPSLGWALVGVPGTIQTEGGKLFEIEGNLICGNASPVGDDWAPPSTSASSSVPPTTVGTCPTGTKAIFTQTGASETALGEITGSRRQDVASSSTDNIFGNGSKQEDTTTWAYVNGSAPAKSDVGNVYALGRRNAALTSMVVILGFERIASNGSAHLDYELNQLPFTPNANGALVPTRCTGTGNPLPGCHTFDMLLAIDDGTSKTPNLRAFQWVGNPCPSPGTPTCPVGKNSGSQGTFTEITFPASAVVFAATNSGGPIPAGPWGTFNRGNLVYNTASNPTPVTADTFSETALDLAHIGLYLGCPDGFATIFIKSRASEEVNSSLKDMITPPIPFDLNTCGKLTINKRNTSDPNNITSLSGASFLITPDPSTGTGSLVVTDGGVGDPDGIANGVIHFAATVPATYTVHETASPLNQVPLPPDQVCAVASKGTCTLTFDNAGTPILLTSFKSASPASSTFVSSGQTITYTITYINTGNAPALSTVITDAVDTRLTSVTPLNGGIYNAANRTITWGVGNVGPGVTGTVQFTAVVISPLSNVTILNTATLTASNAATVITNTTNHPVGPPVLSLTKSVDKAVAAPGGTLVYTLNYSNTGGGDATGVVITDALPAKTTFSSATNSGTFASGTVTWNIGTVLHGASGSVSFTVTLDAVFPQGTTPVTNSAVMTSTEVPTTPSNPVTTNVNAAVNLSITKTLLSNVQRTIVNLTNTATVKSTEDPTGKSESEVIASVVKGADITYTIAYANNGNADATNLVITDTLPAGSVFVSATGGGAYNAGTNTVTWNIGTVVANGGNGSVNLVIRTGL